jgi:hypothetical protein
MVVRNSDSGRHLPIPLIKLRKSMTFLYSAMSKVGIDRLERLCALAIRKGTNLRGINTYSERMNKRCCIPDILQGRRKGLGVKSPESILILCVPAVLRMLHGCTSIPIKLHALISFPDRIRPHWEQDSNHYAVIPRTRYNWPGKLQGFQNRLL